MRVLGALGLARPAEHTCGAAQQDRVWGLSVLTGAAAAAIGGGAVGAVTTAEAKGAELMDRIVTLCSDGEPLVQLRALAVLSAWVADRHTWSASTHRFFAQQEGLTKLQDLVAALTASLDWEVQCGLLDVLRELSLRSAEAAAAPPVAGGDGARVAKDSQAWLPVCIRSIIGTSKSIFRPTRAKVCALVARLAACASLAIPVYLVF